MEASARFYTFTYAETKTYLWVAVFVACKSLGHISSASTYKRIVEAIPDTSWQS